MPLPIWLIPVALKGAAVVAGVAGVGSAAQGVMKRWKLRKVVMKEITRDLRKRTKKQANLWISLENWKWKFCIVLVILLMFLNR